MEEDLLQITAEESGERIDALLARILPELSRSAAQRLLEEERVLLRGRPVKKNYKCAAGDRFSLSLPKEAEDLPLLPQAIPLDVVYEDADVIVVNKPAGLVVHPAPGHPDGTLVNALLHHCAGSLSGVGGALRPGIVHRIDRDTSGLLIVAKTDRAHLGLAEQIAVHSFSREYEAIACGRFREESGTVHAPIGRDPRDRQKMCVTERNSKDAVTHWQVLLQGEKYAHIRCKLETGRTHQIRVHMNYIGHPLFNDDRYGGDRVLKGPLYTKYKQFIDNCFQIMPRQALHAKTLGFIHPTTRKEVFFDSEIPADMTALIEKWRKYAARLNEAEEI